MTSFCRDAEIQALAERLVACQGGTGDEIGTPAAGDPAARASCSQTELDRL